MIESLWETRHPALASPRLRSLRALRVNPAFRPAPFRPVLPTPNHAPLAPASTSCDFPPRRPILDRVSIPLSENPVRLTPLSQAGVSRTAAGTPSVSLHASASETRQWSRAADFTAQRLGLATLAYVVATTVVITMAPFRFSTHPLHGLSTEWTKFDLVMNVAMFIPLGFLFRVTRPRGAPHAWWMAIALGALLSCTIESAQLFESTRYSSLLDVLTNTAGAAIGSLLFTRLAHRLRPGASAVRSLALELPLMGLVYLLLPLMWLVGLAGGGAGGDSGSERAWLLLPLAAFGGAIIGAIHGAYLQPAERVSAFGLVAASGSWFLIAAIPGGRLEPRVLLAGTIVAMGTAWLRSRAAARARTRHGSGPHRFELPTLRLVLPLFAAYLALTALWPLTGATGTWQAGVELFPAFRTELSQRMVFQALEYTAAFTVAGYIIAEFHGRATANYRAVQFTVLRWGGALAVMLELARGWHAAFGASVLAATLAVAASVFGGWLYHLQREHVRALWARDRGHRPDNSTNNQTDNYPSNYTLSPAGSSSTASSEPSA